MSNVFDFRTGEAVLVPQEKPEPSAATLIELLYQRRHQFTDLIFMAYDTQGEPILGIACGEENTARAMASHLDDQIRLRDD